MTLHTQRKVYLPPCLWTYSRSTASTAVHVGCLRFPLSPALMLPPLNARIWYWLCPLQRVRFTRNTLSPLPIALTFCPALATLLTTLRRTQPSAVTSSPSLAAAAAAPSSTASEESALDAEGRADRASRTASMPAARTSLGTVLMSAELTSQLTWPGPVSAALSRPCAPRTQQSCASARRAEFSLHDMSGQLTCRIRGRYDVTRSPGVDPSYSAASSCRQVLRHLKTYKVPLDPESEHLVRRLRVRVVTVFRFAEVDCCQFPQRHSRTHQAWCRCRGRRTWHRGLASAQCQP